MLAIGAFTTVTYTSCNKDECKDVVCNNGGTCVAGICACPTGWEGTSCNTRTRDKFLAPSGGTSTWAGSDACTSGNYTITLTIGASSQDLNVLVSNPGGFGGTVTITGTVTGTNTVSFSNQSVGGGRILTGTMNFSGGTSSSPNAMTFTYTVTPTVGSPDQCTGNYTRQ